MIEIANARVLVVEDDAVMRSFVTNALQRLGVREVKDCVDGDSALALVASFKPDVVLTDVHMDPTDGFEFVRRLREHPDHALRKTPVIFMSADSSSTTLQEALPLGTFGYIVKPPSSATLRAKLERALRA